MTQSFETAGKAAMASLAEKQQQELLLLLGSALAVLLSLLLFVISWTQGIPENRLAGETTTVVVNVVLGAALWVAAMIVRKNPINGAIVAGIVSVILLAFGGLPGTIGGLIGLFGAILAAVGPYMPWAKSR